MGNNDNDKFKNEIEYELLDNSVYNKYVLKDESNKLIMEDKEIDYLIQYKKSEIEALRQIRKLEKIRDAIGDRNPKDIENEYFKKFNCVTEKSKIELEAGYIKSKMIAQRDRYSSYPNYDLNLRLITHILNSINKITANDYENIKQCIILIELDLRLDIAFFSELENVYNLKTKKKETDDKSYTRGL